MNKIKETRVYNVQVLTFVHVGDGEKLGVWDFYQEGEKGKVRVVDVDAFLERFGNDARRMAAFADPALRRGWSDWRNEPNNRSVRDEIPILRSMTGPMSWTANEIRKQIRTGLGVPIIPGSSIKGAIRTAVLKRLAGNAATSVNRKLENLLADKSRRNPRRADDELDRFLFGKDPHHDLMRALQVSDVAFRDKDVSVMRVKIRGLGHSGGYYKSRGRGQDDMDIFAEAINPGARGKLRITLDRHLMSPPQAKVLEFGDKAACLDDLHGILNERAREALEDDKQFFREAHMQEIVRQAEVLLGHVQRAGKDVAALRLGWGVGWKGTTGDLLDAEMLQRFRSAFPIMGVKEGFPYPKTRKVVHMEDQLPLTLGWIWLSRLRKEEGTP
ncbi:MAG: type III-A CRISPR-associated RAMP protein Csm5 [Deltaproteobacteria bacterium]|nr:type III-A CRISPR-associated RAMP protein Csm5 [Deltaproteobacteria bacterium]